MNHGVQIDSELEARLINWRNTVRGHRCGGSGASSSWANMYIAARNDRERALAISLKIAQPENVLWRCDNNELDGWMVESAVRSLIYFDQKQLLRFKFVFEYPNHFIKTKLRINDASIRIVLARGLNNLKEVLEKIDTPAKIRTNNLHARYVPRL